MTQEEVAARAGFTGKYISEWGRDLRNLPVTSLRAIVEDGLGAALSQAFPVWESSVRAGLPRVVLDVAREIARLLEPDRRSIATIVRATIGLKRGG